MADGKPVERGWSMHAEGTVFRFDQRTGEASLIDADLSIRRTGSRSGLDGLLYASETSPATSTATWIEDGRGGRRARDVRRRHPPGLRRTGWARARWDGVQRRRGRLWVAVFGQGDITVLDRDGEVERRIAVGSTLAGRTSPSASTATRGSISSATSAVRSGASIDAGATGLPLYAARARSRPLNDFDTASAVARSDADGIAALVDRAYGHYVERLEMRPRPMTSMTTAR